MNAVIDQDVSTWHPWPAVEVDLGEPLCARDADASPRIRLTVVEAASAERWLPDYDAVELYVQCDGEARLHRVGHEPLTFGAHSSALLLHRRGDRARWLAVSPTVRYMSLLCDVAFFASLVPPGVGEVRPYSHWLGTAGHLLSPLRPACARLAEELIAARRRPRLGGLLAQAKAVELLCAAAQECVAAGDEMPPPLRERDIARLHLTRRIIREHLEEAPTIPQLARAVGLNQQKLKVGFKRVFGQTVFEFTLDERMKAALMLLERDGLPIKTVASRVGYRDPTSFSRAFERHWGILPSAARRFDGTLR